MTLIVEDGSIVSGANTYGSDFDADDYFTYERPGVTDWFALSDDQKEASLRFATKLLDNECWLGLRVAPNVQYLAWPRASVWDADRLRYFPTDEIPTFLRCALYEFAVALSREDRTLVAEGAGGAGLERVKIDVLEIEWMENAARAAAGAKPLMPKIVSDLIDPYLAKTSDGITVKTLRT